MTQKQKKKRQSQINLEAFKNAVNTVQKIQEAKAVSKPRPLHTMAKIQVAFLIRFVCDAEARLNSTVKQYNEDRLKVEKAANRTNRTLIAQLLQDNLSRQLPNGISCIVEDSTNPYNSRNRRIRTL